MNFYEFFFLQRRQFCDRNILTRRLPLLLPPYFSVAVPSVQSTRLGSLSPESSAGKPNLSFKLKTKELCFSLIFPVRLRYAPLGAPCLTVFRSYLLQLDSSKFHLRPSSLELKGKHIRFNHINQNVFAGKCSPALALQDGVKQH